MVALVLVGHSPDVCSRLRGARKQPIGLDYTTAYGHATTQTQDCGAQIQQAGTELLELLVIQFRVKREV